VRSSRFGTEMAKEIKEIAVLLPKGQCRKTTEQRPVGAQDGVKPGIGGGEGRREKKAVILLRGHDAERGPVSREQKVCGGQGGGGNNVTDGPRGETRRGGGKKKNCRPRILYKKVGVNVYEEKLCVFRIEDERIDHTQPYTRQLEKVVAIKSKERYCMVRGNA